MAGGRLRLSVGVPVYNQAQTIEETILSLLRQTVPPYEIVICENHSTDGTDRIVQRYADRVRVIRPPRHLEMMVNWNHLVGELRGDWFSLLSGDDIAKPKFVETLLTGIGRSEHAVLVRAGFQLIDGEGRLGAERLLLSVRRREVPPRTLYESLAGPKASFSSFAVRHEAWRIAGGFPEVQKLSGDWGLWVRLAPLGDFIYEPSIISLYRTNYRPGLGKQRFACRLRDGVYLQTTLIPDAAAKIPSIDKRRVSRARRNYLRRALIAASTMTAPDERTEFVEILHPLALTAANHRLLRWLSTGAPIGNMSILPKFHGFMRACIPRMVMSFHRDTSIEP